MAGWEWLKGNMDSLAWRHKFSNCFKRQRFRKNGGAFFFRPFRGGIFDKFNL